MKILLFYHSLLSDWNHGNAHFLRGITTELMKRGHDVHVYEPRNGWSYNNWIRENGVDGLAAFEEKYPHLDSTFYDPRTDFDQILEGADLVIVHEWNEAPLVKLLGDLKKRYNYRLLFHDTHHRSVTSPEEIRKYDLKYYDGVLAFGEKIRNLYLENRWARQAWTWHEAADTGIFRPVEGQERRGDVVWIGNWGDDERTDELNEFLIEPVKRLGLKAKMYGVRYPAGAVKLLEEAGIEYGGYLPSYRVPEVFVEYRFTVHVPRKAYARSLPGIPTIRPFEALACGIPMLSAPWEDSENLFRAGEDFMMVRNGEEMTRAMNRLLQDPSASETMINSGLETVRNHHTCAHRVDELMTIWNSMETGYQIEKSNLLTAKPA